MKRVQFACTAAYTQHRYSRSLIEHRLIRFREGQRKALRFSTLPSQCAQCVQSFRCICYVAIR